MTEPAGLFRMFRSLHGARPDNTRAPGTACSRVQLAYCVPPDRNREHLSCDRIRRGDDRPSLSVRRPGPLSRACRTGYAQTAMGRVSNGDRSSISNSTSERRPSAHTSGAQDLAPDFRLPDASEEAQDPDQPTAFTGQWIRRLIDLRRGPKYPLILNDNIAYGFWRNLLGMKGVALALAGCALAAIVVARTARVTTGDAPIWGAAWGTPATEVAGIALLILWAAFLLIIVRPPRVWDAGVAYAERLLASLPPPSVPKPRAGRRKAKTKAPSEPMANYAHTGGADDGGVQPAKCSRPVAKLGSMAGPRTLPP